MAEITVFYFGPIVSRAEAAASGLKRYFTGKPCRHGHIDQRLICNKDCYTCSKVRAAAYFRTEKGLQALRDYQKTERGRESMHRYRISEKGKTASRLGQAKRRARQQSVEGDFTQADFLKLRAVQKKCHICKKPFTKAKPATIDHIIPIALGGTHNLGNIALAHGGCNSRKNDMRTHLL